MEVKFGKIRPSNLFSGPTANSAGENFFASNNNLQNDENKKQQQPTFGRINDYDSSILENNAYQVLPDEMLKIEHRMGILEKTLEKLNGQASVLGSFGDNLEIRENEARKKVIEAELADLKKKYGELGFGAKISGGIASVIGFTSGKGDSLLTKAKNFWSKHVMSKVSKEFSQNNEMKTALEKLSNINSNVDELITMHVPYGETVDRYEKLTSYLNKANVIHSQISKNLKEAK